MPAQKSGRVRQGLTAPAKSPDCERGASGRATPEGRKRKPRRGEQTRGSAASPTKTDQARERKRAGEMGRAARAGREGGGAKKR